MNAFLWVLQGLLAAMFATAFVLKTTQPKERLQPKLAWVEDYSTGTIRFIGAVEGAAALGLILPAVTGITTVLTPLAATGLVVTMALAAVVHVRRKEPGAVVFNLVLCALAAVVAWGRFGPYSF